MASGIRHLITRNHSYFIHKSAVAMETHNPNKVILTPKENRAWRDRAQSCKWTTIKTDHKHYFFVRTQTKNWRLNIF